MKNLETGHFNAPTFPITKNNDEIRGVKRGKPSNSSDVDGLTD